MWLIISTPSKPASLIADIFSSTEPFQADGRPHDAFLMGRFGEAKVGSLFFRQKHRRSRRRESERSRHHSLKLTAIHIIKRNVRLVRKFVIRISFVIRQPDKSGRSCVVLIFAFRNSPQTTFVLPGIATCTTGAGVSHVSFSGRELCCEFMASSQVTSWPV